MKKLRLGPIPKTETTKLTIFMSAKLKSDLDRYAELHSKVWGEVVDTSTLIPHILETFIKRDRGFTKAHSASSTALSHPVSSLVETNERL